MNGSKETRKLFCLSLSSQEKRNVFAQCMWTIENRVRCVLDISHTVRRINMKASVIVSQCACMTCGHHEEAFCRFIVSWLYAECVSPLDALASAVGCQCDLMPVQVYRKSYHSNVKFVFTFTIYSYWVIWAILLSLVLKKRQHFLETKRLKCVGSHITDELQTNQDNMQSWEVKEIVVFIFFKTLVVGLIVQWFHINCHEPPDAAGLIIHNAFYFKWWKCGETKK